MAKVSVTQTETGRVCRLEVDLDFTVGLFKDLLAEDFQIPRNDQVLSVTAGSGELSDDQSLRDVGVADGSMLVLRSKSSTARRASGSAARRPNNGGDPLANLDFSHIQVGGPSSSSSATSAEAPPSAAAAALSTEAQLTAKAVIHAKQIMREAELRPETVGMIESRDRELGEALRKKDAVKIQEIVRKRLVAAREEKEKIARVMANPYSAEAQEMMLKTIQQQNINQAFEHAQEYIPESFGSVSMLYVKIELNDIPIPAFVDSGAQSTIMSLKCAERCNLAHLIDTRFLGVAQGVGTSKIAGRVHVTKIKMGSTFFEASLTILEDDKVDFLFGLDLLRRYQCSIDLKADVLRIGDEALPFMSDAEVRKFCGPGGMPFGQRMPSVGSPSSSAAPGGSTSSGETGAAQPAPSQVFKAEDVTRLIELGFSETEARSALQVTGGDADAAAGFLLQRSPSNTLS